MRRLIVLFLIVLSVANAMQIAEVLRDDGYAEKQLFDGYREFHKDHDSHSDTVLLGGYKTVYEDRDLFTLFAQTLLSFTQQDKDDVLISCSKGGKPDFFKFFSTESGIVGLKGSETISLEPRGDDCFESVTVQYTVLTKNSVQLVFTPGARRAGTVANCKDAYVIGSTENYHTVVMKTPEKSHQFTLKNMLPAHVKAIHTFGLRIFKTCDKFANILPDLLLTVGLFAGGLGSDPNVPIFGSKPTWWMEVLNPLFIKRATGYQWQLRLNQTFVDLEETEVHAGDFLMITRMDGLDQIIQWGTGSRSGHSVTILEIDGEKWAVESQDAWYWPVKNIQKNRWSDWKQYALNAGFNVALLPLSPASQKKFNNTAAVEWFSTVEGLPYGYHNFLFGWVDTPHSNVPPLLDLNFVYSVFTLIEKFIPSVPKSLIGEAVNFRLGTKNLNLAQAYNVMFERNLTVGEVFAMPEQDEWVYSDGKSMVCSAFVAAVWKAGGLFAGLDNIQATEFTPRDVYQTNFFDLHYKKPAKCHHDGLPYCQIMGRYRMDAATDGYSTINPYSGMFQTCPSIAPLYERPLGC